ncbi:potassium-transporting ATPase subunit KdpA [Heliobacterium undosum]|uniref:Potassium-transporting ATPase potassium-binding subunit n=1 Tax=Heliomicrobium undosum TaxID=121734 RepID=A0A845L5K8_9FIRM|nr:potassium-transporting ATPase subunit KdpA [Heliomicrobium undosum]MZP29950.1 potassium-transporting ATPase subunit KdpA [Heliomicrobium undosum]
MDVLQFGLFLSILFALAVPLGIYMARMYDGGPTRLDGLFSPMEKLIYRLTGVDHHREMNWKEYATSLFTFNMFGFLLLFLNLVFQHMLPLNPQGFGPVVPDLAFNTAISFMTNTNWQAYGGEITLSYFSQMAGLTVQNFVSAATGMVVVIALIRGLVRHTTQTIGNFWVDLTRTVLRILLPICLIGSLVLVSQGMIQNLSPYVSASTMEGGSQTIAMGPTASQVIIKMLGTNGGGFFNANSAHPFENPTPLTNLMEMLSIFVIPAALTITFGRMVGNMRQGLSILAAMTMLFLLMLGTLYTSEIIGNPQIAAMGVSGPTAMEGKEVRFGIGNSALFATVTTAASCGAVNAMHDSLTPLGGLAPMLQMMLGEVVFGGVGAGLYGMLMFVMLTVFIVGLMVGRTPEYLGKKIESWEMKMATLAILIPGGMILVLSAWASVTPAGTASILNPGPHGLSEILYAFASGVGNNGSAFGGLSANTLFYNLLMGLAMFIGRFGVIIPALAIAGSMAAKKVTPAGAGTFETTGPLFSSLLAGTVLIVGALTFFPALALGPIVEQLLMLAGQAF